MSFRYFYENKHYFCYDVRYDEYAHFSCSLLLILQALLRRRYLQSFFNKSVRKHCKEISIIVRVFVFTSYLMLSSCITTEKYCTAYTGKYESEKTRILTYFSQCIVEITTN